MTTELVAIVLTVLAAVVVVLTRVRMTDVSAAAGRISVPSGLLHTHTAAGTAALALWVAYLVVSNGWLGGAALLLWWVTVAAGLGILLRWIPAHGRHSSGPVVDSWGSGPGLSVLAHVGLLVGVVVFTLLFSLSAL